MCWNKFIAQAFLALVIAGPCATVSATGGGEEVEQKKSPQLHYIIDPATKIRIALWRVAPYSHSSNSNVNSKVVLFIHGATISGGMSAGYRINGYSWADDVARSGRDTWIIDFPGYGHSSNYQEMSENVWQSKDLPIGTAETLVPIIDQAVNYILDQTRQDKLSLVATSRGVIPVGYYLESHQDKVERVVFNTPIVRRDSVSPDLLEKILLSSEKPKVNYYDIPIGMRLGMLKDDRPEGTPVQLDKGFIDNWPRDSVSERGAINNSLRVPGGFARDIFDAWHGKYWSLSSIKIPVLIIRGDYDKYLTTQDDVNWLFENLKNVPSKRLVLIDSGTHAMLFERKRFELYREVQLFLNNEYKKL